MQHHRVMLFFDPEPAGLEKFEIPAVLDEDNFASLNLDATEIQASAWFSVSDLEFILENKSTGEVIVSATPDDPNASLIAVGAAAGVDQKGAGGFSDLTFETGFAVNAESNPQILYEMAEQTGQQLMNTFQAFEDAYADGVQAMDDIGDLLNCSGFGLSQVLFILAKIEETIDNVQTSIEEGIADNPLMRLFAPDAGDTIKEFTVHFDTAEEAIASSEKR